MKGIKQYDIILNECDHYLIALYRNGKLGFFGLVNGEEWSVNKKYIKKIFYIKKEFSLGILIYRSRHIKDYIEEYVDNGS